MLPAAGGPVDSGNCSPSHPGHYRSGPRENLTALPEASGVPLWERTSWDAERETLQEAPQCGRVKCPACEKQAQIIATVYSDLHVYLLS
ncbi:claudin-12 isoform X2 [Macaca mulatta]